MICLTDRGGEDITKLVPGDRAGGYLVIRSCLQAYRADANTRDYAGKKPRQYMIVGDTGGMGLSMSSDTFRQLKDRRKNRTSRMEKNPGILRFGSLSVKVGF